MPVMAPRQARLSVNVTVKGASTVALAAGVITGGVSEAEAGIPPMMILSKRQLPELLFRALPAALTHDRSRGRVDKPQGKLRVVCSGRIGNDLCQIGVPLLSGDARANIVSRH